MRFPFPLLEGRTGMVFFKRQRNFGMILLAVWFILYGLFYFAKNVVPEHQGLLLAVVGIAAGVLIFLGR